MTLRELTVCTHLPYRFPETILFPLSEIGAKSMRNSCESLAAAQFPHKPHTLFPNNGFSAQKTRAGIAAGSLDRIFYSSVASSCS